MADPIKPDMINLMSLVKGFGLPEPGQQSMAQEFPDAYPALGFGMNAEIPPMTIAPPAWLNALVTATMPPNSATPMPMVPQNSAPASPIPATDTEIAAGTAAAANPGWPPQETQAALAGTPADTGGNEPVNTGTPAPASPPAGPVRTDEYTVTPSGQMTEGAPAPQTTPQATPPKKLSPEEVLGPELWGQLQERAARVPGFLNWIGVGLQGSVNPEAAQRSMETWRVDKNQAQQEMLQATERTSTYNSEAERQFMRQREADVKAETELAKSQSQIDKEMARQRSINFRTALSSLKSPAARATLMGVQNLATKVKLSDEEEAALDSAQNEAMAKEQDYLNDQQVGAEVIRLAPMVGKGEAPAALLDFTISKIKDPEEKAAYAQIARELGTQGAKIREANMAGKTASVEAAKIKAEASRDVARMSLWGQTLKSRTQIESERANVLTQQAKIQTEIVKTQGLLANPDIDEDVRRKLETSLSELESSVMQYDGQLQVLESLREEARNTPQDTSTGTPSQLVSPKSKGMAGKLRLAPAWTQVWDRSLVTAAEMGVLSNPSAVGSMDARKIEQYLTSTASQAELEQVADIVLDNLEYLTGMERDRLVTELNGRLASLHEDRIKSTWKLNMFEGSPPMVSPAGPAALNTIKGESGQPSNMIFNQESQ